MRRRIVIRCFPSWREVRTATGTISPLRQLPAARLFSLSSRLCRELHAAGPARLASLGAILWAWLNLGVYGIGLWRLVATFRRRHWSGARQSLFFLVALLVGLRGLWNGQSNALAVGLLLMGAADLNRGRCWRFGVLAGRRGCTQTHAARPGAAPAGGFASVPVLALPLALAGIGLVPFLLGPTAMVWRHHEEWVLHLTTSSSKRWPGFRDAWTLYLAGKNLLGLAPGPLPLEEPLQGHGYHLLQLLTAAAALVWSLRRNRHVAQPDSWHQSRQQLLETLAIGLVWLMLFGPAVEWAGFAFLAPVLVWAVVEPATARVRQTLALLAAGLILVVGCHPVSMLLRPVLPGGVVGDLPLGTCLVLVWLLTRSRPGMAPRSLEAPRKDSLQKSGLSPWSSRAMRAALRPQAPWTPAPG